MDIVKATTKDTDIVWALLKEGIQKRKVEGSTQWQSGYPNLEVVHADIQKEIGYILKNENGISVAYCALDNTGDPNYVNIKGKWLTEGAYAVIHRLVVSQNHLGRGYAKALMLKLEALCVNNNIYSIKIDTHSDNQAMQKIIKDLGYIYCGEISVSDGPRMAFEKKIQKSFL